MLTYINSVNDNFERGFMNICNTNPIKANVQ